MVVQRRMLEAGPLLKRDGSLVEKGYSQGLIKRLNSVYYGKAKANLWLGELLSSV